MVAGQRRAGWTRMLPGFLRRQAKKLLRLDTPAVGTVRWGELRRTSPFSRCFGYDRGTPVDRYYIEAFLSSWSADIKGHVLEIKDSGYTTRFGGSRVTASDVLDIDPGNPAATIIADLDAAAELPDEQFDCIILTQTLQFVYRPEAAFRDLHRSLKPGGVLLLTVPGLTPVKTRDMKWYWSFTNLVVQRLLAEHFLPENIQLTTYGNLLSATAFLHGLCGEELRPDELALYDPDYQVIIAARAVRSR